MESICETPAELAGLLCELIPYLAGGVLYADEEGRIVQADPEAERVLSRSAETLTGVKIGALFPTDVCALLDASERIVTKCEYQGNVLRLSKWASPRFSGAFYFLGEALTMESQRQEIGYLNEKVEDLRSTIQSSYDGIYVTDRNGYTLLVNKSHERISGIPSERLVGRYMKDLVKEGVFEVTLTDTVVREKRAVTVTQAASNGKNYLITGTPIFDGDGEVKKVITNVRDITELLQLEKELRRSEEIKEKYRNKLFQQAETDIVVVSASFAETMLLARKAASKSSTVLILGETGVGKEVVAKYIHLSSERRKKDYLKINCGAIPPNLLESELFGYVKGAFTGASQSGKMGIFELANGGTLFLDEIGELPLNLQASLLRVLQDGEITRVGDTKRRKVDVRIIAATNRNLEEMIRQNQFRMDLYYRLNVFSILVPPLRERVDDIPALAEAFIKKLNEKYKTRKMLTTSFIRYLCQRDWPGNVRELQNFIERQYAICDEDVLDASDIFEQGAPGAKKPGVHVIVTGIPPMKDAVAELRRKLLEKALQQGGNTYRAAELLGISQATFSRQYTELCGPEKE